MSEPALKREATVQEARRLFIDTGIETDITKAYERYLSEHPEVKFPARITKNDKQYIVPKVMFIKHRPLCPECGELMGLWRVNSGPRDQVGGDFKTQWVCSDEETCGYQGDYSELTIKEQIKKHA